MSEKRLLIVDDDVAVGELIERIGSKQGFVTKVLHESTGFEAVCDSFAPHVILLDMVMPNIDGVELLQRLAERGTTARIIFVTGFDSSYLTMAEHLGEARGLGSIRTLSKPIDIDELRGALAG